MSQRWSSIFCATGAWKKMLKFYRFLELYKIFISFGLFVEFWFSCIFHITVAILYFKEKPFIVIIILPVVYTVSFRQFVNEKQFFNLSLLLCGIQTILKRTTGSSSKSAVIYFRFPNKTLKSWKLRSVIRFKNFLFSKYA